MFSNRSTSLVPPNNNDNQYLYPAYSCDHLLAPPSFYLHYKSEPNVTLHFYNQVCINIKYVFIYILYMYITFNETERKTRNIIMFKIRQISNVNRHEFAKAIILNAIEK